MANIAASLGAQIPRSVINPVTKRWGYVKDVSNSFTIECCSLICSMCSHNPNSLTFQSVTSTQFSCHGLVLFFLMMYISRAKGLLKTVLFCFTSQPVFQSYSKQCAKIPCKPIKIFVQKLFFISQNES